MQAGMRKLARAARAVGGGLDGGVIQGGGVQSLALTLSGSSWRNVGFIQSGR